ncbi:jg16825 [Pararge aegeria aegeria]|uniref:Jg16825 protein n=1 Tax=Pararge aegeria aegeria TaxID=348720 RepID=A0A8S4SGG3_9NEOP|nr:jg16825 [Pararge aegeria aegeria]
MLIFYNSKGLRTLHEFPHRKLKSLSERWKERDQIKNEEIRRRTSVTKIAQRVAKLAKGGAHITENHCTLGSQCPTHWDPNVQWQPRTGKRSVGRPPTRRTDVAGAAENKRPRIVELKTAY